MIQKIRLLELNLEFIWLWGHIANKHLSLLSTSISTILQCSAEANFMCAHYVLSGSVV